MLRILAHRNVNPKTKSVAQIRVPLHVYTLGIPKGVQARHRKFSFTCSAAESGTQIGIFELT